MFVRTVDISRTSAEGAHLSTWVSNPILGAALRVSVLGMGSIGCESMNKNWCLLLSKGRPNLGHEEKGVCVGIGVNIQAGIPLLVVRS